MALPLAARGITVEGVEASAAMVERLRAKPGPLRLRYCWASELDLMVRLAGLRLRERYQDWDRGPFTESRDRISVFEVTAAPAG